MKDKQQHEKRNSKQFLIPSLTNYNNLLFILSYKVHADVSRLRRDVCLGTGFLL